MKNKIESILNQVGRNVLYQVSDQIWCRVYGQIGGQFSVPTGNHIGGDNLVQNIFYQLKIERIKY